jgi:hypothetical protein
MAFNPLWILAGLEVASGVFSFSEAKKARDEQKDAQRAAALAMKEARKKLEVNYLRGLSIAKEPYELEREAMAQTAASALQAGVEGDPRGAAATAGRVMQTQQRMAAQQRAAMSKEMANLEQLAAQEDTQLQRMRTSLDVGEAVGAQKYAQDMGQRSLAMKQQGIENIIGGVKTGIQAFNERPKGGDPLPEGDTKTDYEAKFNQMGEDVRNRYYNPDGTFRNPLTLPDPYTLQGLYGLQGVTIEDTINQESIYPSTRMQ